MTQYKYQTNPALLLEGELGLNGSDQLVAGTGTGNEVVGNPASSTPVPSLTPNYAEEIMDLSSAKTLGAGFIFLNGTSFDSVGGCNYEFEEADGRVYALYGRSDGMSQQLFFAGAANNQSDLQYTTVPYVPSFLSSSVWQAASVIGSDLFGFTLVLRDTSASTPAYRYLYVRHNGSLINTAAHTYVEITQLVQAYISFSGVHAGNQPRVIRVGAYFFITLQSWDQASVWIGGWNAQDTSFPFSGAALSGTVATYNPTQFNIQTNNWPGVPGQSTASVFPLVMGNSSAVPVTTLCQFYDVTNNVTIPAVNGNWPLPPTTQWINDSLAFLEGEVDGSGNVFLAFGSQGQFNGPAGQGVNFELIYSLAVQFTAGSAGAFTNAWLTYNTPGTGGTDLLHCQPSTLPFTVGFNPAETLPNETVNAVAGNPATCVNKLPMAHAYLGQNEGGGAGTGMFINWYYSGAAGISRQGSSFMARAKVTLRSGNNLGSAAAAQANKLATLYPMFNVNPRANLSGASGQPYSRATVVPSGVASSMNPGMLIAQDTVLSPVLDKSRNWKWAVSKLPTNSVLGNATYNRNGSFVPGMGARVAEFLTNMPTQPDGAINTMCNVYPNGGTPSAPINVIVPTISNVLPLGLNGNTSNNKQIRLGHWTLSGTTYQTPPVVWTTASNMDAQIAAIQNTVFAAALSAYPDRYGNILHTELIPLFNSTGTDVTQFLGIQWIAQLGTAGANNMQAYFFTTSASTAGGVLTMANTGSATIVTRSAYGLPGGVVFATNGNDTIFGRLHQVWLDGTNQLLMWTQSNGQQVVGDTHSVNLFAKLSGNTFTSTNTMVSSVGRAFFQCHSQSQGLTWSPQTSVSYPCSDLAVSRYTTSAVNTLSDFQASFNQAIATPNNADANLAELMTLTAINNNFLLQIGSINGRINHKEYSLPSSFIDMTSQPVGTYYLYVVDTGSTGVQLQFDSVQRPETSTNMFFGQFDRTSSGFANESSISEMVRFGTARLVLGSNGSPVRGSSIRIGPYVG